MPFHHRIVETMVHIIGWAIVFAFPFLMMSRSGYQFTLQDYLWHGSVVPLSFLVVFYVNYFILVPRYLFREQTRNYLLLALLLIAIVAAGSHLWQDYCYHHFDANDTAGGQKPMGPPRYLFVIRDALSMVLTIALSTSVRAMGRWAQTEAARREAEKSRTEAELKNLRNQLNPHFLLNTLNNIYALIAFDADKAQQAVQELSRLLRHLLYENQLPRVSLDKEMDFVRNYIELMRIRLADNVALETSFDISPHSRTEIAPLIFISLIENAFKHGISPTEPSYIRIHFSEDAQSVTCDIRNSCHPKTQTDKSGSGIGLEQVSKRLELTYPGQYSWTRGPSADGREYRSTLVINVQTAPILP